MDVGEDDVDDSGELESIYSGMTPPQDVLTDGWNREVPPSSWNSSPAFYPRQVSGGSGE